MKSGACLLIILSLACAFFLPNILRGGLMLPMDLFHHLDPFSASVPPDLEQIHNPLLWDLAVMIYPWVEEFIRSGPWLPLWNPYSFCGSPLLANGQTGLLHPLSWIYRLLPLGAALLVIAIAKLTFCGVFAFLFYRKLEFHPQACLLGALATMFGMLTVVWLGYPASLSLTTMPFLFWSLQTYLRGRRHRDIVWIACGYGLMFLGGGLQTAFLISIASAIYFVVAAKSVKLYPALALAALLGFCLAAPQLLPFFEYLKEGSASHFRGGFGWKPYPWFTMLSWAMPRFFGDPRAGNFWGFSSYLGEAVYIGMAPLLLAAAGLVLARKNRYYWGMLAVAACGILGLYCAPLQDLLKHVPFLSHLDNNKFPALSVFGAIYFAVAGLDFMLRREDGPGRARARAIWIAASTFWMALTAWAALFFREAIRQMNLSGFLTREAFLQLGFLLATTVLFWLWHSGRLRPSSAAWILLLLTASDLMRLSIYYYPSPPDGRRLPASTSVGFLQKNLGENRFLGLAGWIPPEISILYRLQDARGIDGHTPYRQYEVMGRIDPAVHDLRARLLSGAPQEGKWTRSTLFYESIRPILENEDPEIRSALRQLDYWSYDVTHIENPELLSVLGVRYLIGPKGSPGPAAAGFPLVHSSDADVWENPACLLRAYLCTRPDFVSGEAEALETISAPGFLKRKTAAIDMRGRPLPARRDRPEERDLVPARIEAYGSQIVRISTDAPEGGWLVLGDLYYPGWEATIDGSAAPIYPANYLFRGVELPPGKHVVEFRFRPQSLRRGIMLCFAALAILAGLLLWRPRP